MKGFAKRAYFKEKHPSGCFFCAQKGSCRECIYAFRGGGIGDGGTDQSVPYESVTNSRLSGSLCGFAAIRGGKPAPYSPRNGNLLVSRGNSSMTGWDGRVAVTEATGPKVTVGGKTYELIGYDKDGAKVYQDAEVVKEQNVSTKGETETYAVDKNSEELLENQGKDSTIQKDNKAVRQWYHDNVARIKDSIDTNLPLEEQARQAFEARNRLRTEARNRMLDQETRKLLDSKRPNLTIEELIESKMRRKAMTREEAIQDVLDTATKTNENVDREQGIGGK